MTSRPALTASHLALALVCVLSPVIETVLVVALIAGEKPSIAPQASALGPFGVFHDLRWLSVYADSWPTFGAMAAGILVARCVLTALSVRLAWPNTTPPPSIGRLFFRGLGATALVALLLIPSLTLLFAMAVVPVSWLFIASVPLALGVALVVPPVAVTEGWWRRTFPLRAVGWVALSFLVLTFAAAVITAVPDWADFLVAIMIGVFNARAWVGMVQAIVNRRETSRAFPVVPVALAAMAAIVAVGSVTGFTHVNPKTAVGAKTALTVPGHGQRAVLVVAGYGSHWNGRQEHPVPGGFFEEQFSYLGLDRSGEPLPYMSTDTVRPLPVLDADMASQVAELAKESGQRVDIVAESEGALVAKTYLVSHKDPPVSTVVLLSPLIEPDRVSYPTGSRATGSGLATRSAMRLLGSLYQSVAPIDLSPASAFLESVDDLAPLLQPVLACPTPGIRQFAFLPLADATAAPPHPTLPYPSVVVPAFHGGLVGSPSTDPLIAEVLDGRIPSTSGALRGLYSLITDGASAWQVPSLSLSDFPRVVPAPKTLVASCQLLESALNSYR